MPGIVLVAEDSIANDRGRNIIPALMEFQNASVHGAPPVPPWLPSIVIGSPLLLPQGWCRGEGGKEGYISIHVIQICIYVISISIHLSVHLSILKAHEHTPM